jgi:hypothetical protein
LVPVGIVGVGVGYEAVAEDALAAASASRAASTCDAFTTPVERTFERDRGRVTPAVQKRARVDQQQTVDNRCRVALAAHLLRAFGSAPPPV